LYSFLIKHTPLTYVIFIKNFNAVELLLKCGANPNQVNGFNIMPIEAALIAGNKYRYLDIMLEINFIYDHNSFVEQCLKILINLCLWLNIFIFSNHNYFSI